MDEEMEKLLKMIAARLEEQPAEESEDPGVDYAGEYRKQTGKDLASGEYTVQ